MSKNEFGFMLGRSTMEPIFCVKQLIEEYREKKNNIAMVFINLKKPYDKVTRVGIVKGFE